MPHKPLLKYFKNYKIPIYDTIALVLLNPENKKYFFYNNSYSYNCYSKPTRN